MKVFIRTPLVWLTVLCAMPLWTLLFPGLPETHDGTIHVARIANFYQSLLDGNMFPRWAANLNWGYGTPILMFVYPLPSYTASLFHAIGFSLVDSTKIVFAVSFLLSAITMFVWIRSLWGVFPAVAASILYAFAPYRFVDLYVRGAIGEHMAFLFPPLVCWALTCLAKSPKRLRLYASIVSLGTAGLILTHNALSVMFLPIILLYAMYLYVFRSKNKRFVLQSVFGIVQGFLLSAFFWIPAMYEQKYTLIDKVTSGNTFGRYTPWSWFLYSPWNYGGGDQITKQLGPVAWVAVAASLAYGVRLKNLRQKWFVWGGIVILVFSLFLMTEQSDFIWRTIPLLEKFQFPWRFLSLTTFITAVLGGFVTWTLRKKPVWIVGLFLVIAVVYTIPFWHPKGYIKKPEHFYTSVFESTTDGGEASPIWSIRFMLIPAQSPIEIISGSAAWKELSRTSTHHRYDVTAATRTQILENTLYFPGWNVYVDGNKTQTEFQDQSHQGLMTFWVEEGRHDISLRFQDTKARRFAAGISLLALVVFAFWHIIRR